MFSAINEYHKNCFVSCDCVEALSFLGHLDEKKHSLDKTMTGEETILLIKQPFQHHQGDNNTFVTDDADVTELENKMIIAL